MRRILVFQHVAVEPLGTLLPLLRRYGLRVRYVNFEREPDAVPSIEGYDGLIVLGGPMSAWDDTGHPHLEHEVAALAAAVERELPVLGICLGAQLLARALGASLGRADRTEIGWHEVRPTEAGRDDPVLGAFAEREHVFQWHRDTFALPPGAVHLAAGDGCAQQAFRYGERAYGLQFHLEADAALIGRWLGTPEQRAELDGLEHTGDAEAIRAETSRRIARSLALAEDTFGRFFDRFGRRPPRARHPHG